MIAEVLCSGIQQKSCRELHADVFVRMQQRKQLCLVLQIRASGIAERVARSAILLVEQVPDVRRVVARHAQFLANHLVREFGQRLRRLHAQPVKVQILGVLARLEELLRFV